VQFGAKGCVTWAEKQIRNYRDYKATDFDLAFAQWIHGINRGVLLPPGLDEQWLISVMHTDADALHYADVFECIRARINCVTNASRSAGLPKMLVRGVFRRCAHCGGKGAFFTGWIARQDRCKTCGFKWERNLEGFQLGAAAMNIISPVVRCCL
jgi:hypothetical protein